QRIFSAFSAPCRTSLRGITKSFFGVFIGIDFLLVQRFCTSRNSILQGVQCLAVKNDACAVYTFWLSFPLSPGLQHRAAVQRLSRSCIVTVQLGEPFYFLRRNRCWILQNEPRHVLATRWCSE